MKRHNGPVLVFAGLITVIVLLALLTLSSGV